MDKDDTSSADVNQLRRALFEAIGLLEFTSTLGVKSPVVVRGREVLNGWTPETESNA